MRDGPEAALFERYNNAAAAAFDSSNCRRRGVAAPVIKRREGESLLAALPKGAFAVALDHGGHALDSEALAARLGQWLAARPVCFLIGGAEGLDAPISPERLSYCRSAR